jgi:hypothetical protein
MPVDLQEVRLRIASRQPISVEETHALFEDAGLFLGRRVIRTASGFIIILAPPPRQGQLQQDEQLFPRIEITEHAIRGIGVRGNREAQQQMALMANLRWGQGATVRVKGNRHLRQACREAGLIVVNNNPHARAWRAITSRLSPARPPAMAPPPAPPQPQAI